ncbi:MAG TPA: ROK family protein [Candidatus Hydrogenedentes bacterium]|jgi:fructokinase|nr:ROK family protein [Candidatus Hydrogenedentota bacterium]HPJ98239.1 ROK family protein [Candidatus Hydrogenedentota bacterium]
MAVFGGIEAGGTKFVCALGSRPDDLREEERFPTTTPEETIGRCIACFEKHARREPITAIGISSFGPVDPNPESATWGYITSTPKPGWGQTPFAGRIAEALGVPVGFDTDVNGAALGENRWGAAQGLDSFIYLTVGTGIGGGGLLGGRLMHGLIHPEMGHVRLPRDKDRDSFEGVCPYHGDCLEGLASGPAMEKRWGTRAEALPDSHPAWDLEAHYLAVALAGFICTLSPQRIILGGGVMERRTLFPKIRENVLAVLNGYVQSPVILDHIDKYIVPPGLGSKAGVLGAIALAQDAARKAGGHG